MYGKNTNNIKRVCCSFWLNLFTQFFFINSKTLCRNVSFETGERQFMSMAKFWHGSLERFHIFPFRLAQFSVLRTLAITEIGHLRFVVNSHTAAAPRPTRSRANSLTGQLAHGPTRSRANSLTGQLAHGPTRSRANSPTTNIVHINTLFHENFSKIILYYVATLHLFVYYFVIFLYHYYIASFFFYC